MEDRDERALEAAFADRRGRAVLAVDAELIALLTAEPLDRGDQVGGDALRHHVVLVAEVVVVGGEAVDVHGRRTRIDSTPPPTTRSWKPARMPHRGEVDGLLAGPAEAVERDAGHRGQPASSAAMRAMSIEWSPLPAPHPITTSSTSAVSNPCGLQCVEHLGEDALRVHGGAAPLALALASRRADGVDDPCFADVCCHGVTLETGADPSSIGAAPQPPLRVVAVGSATVGRIASHTDASSKPNAQSATPSRRYLRARSIRETDAVAVDVVHLAGLHAARDTVGHLEVVLEHPLTGLVDTHRLRLTELDEFVDGASRHRRTSLHLARGTLA